VGLRPVTPAAAALAAALLLVATACGGSDNSSSTAGIQTSGRTAPPAVRYDQHVSAGLIAPPAASLTNPLHSDARAAAAGAQLFSAMNCDGCHGGGATGFVAPSLVDGRWRYGGDDGALFHSIYYGRPRGMPAYGGILSDGTIWQIVTYLRAQPVASDVATERWR